MKVKTYTITEMLYLDFDEYVGFANTFVKDYDMAQDVVQDVFLQLITSNSNHLLWVDTAGSSKSYIKKIIAVRCLSKKSQFYKKNIEYNKNKVTVELYELENILHEKTNNISNYDKVKYDLVLQTLSTFDEYDRSLFLLYYESDLTYEELSKEIGIPKISIYNTIRKVKKKTKEKLNIKK